jgi:flagellar assembly protein FliH
MSTVIKASGPIRLANGMSFNFDDLGVQAGQYLDDVRAQAGKILAQAEKDAEAIRRRAETEGKQAAIQAVQKVMEEKVGKQLASLLPALRKAVDDLGQSKQIWLSHWEKSAVHVACQIAGRIVRRQVEREPDITLALVREALELAAGSSEIRLHLHPDDRTALGSQVEKLAAELAGEGRASIVADPQIERGSCRIETRFGAIDQQFAAQLARIEEELT